ncbi:unnamed protein product [Prorocentrum cordatum]|uniref:RNA-directed RNA polymerase n=1 Tax=Prorocentrum cordatum TaxID=2364126 RepID=A0ABN9V290_9DINO|nr:unnamed protein product [Polarella glacialis]
MGPPPALISHFQTAGVRALELLALRQSIISGVPPCPAVSLACPPANLTCPPQEMMIAHRPLRPLAAEGEWCADLAVGTLVRVSYTGETMDHTRVVLWPSRRLDQRRRVRGRHAYWVLSADGDVWEEDLSGRNAATGPSGGSLLDQATGDPPDGRRLYRFRARPSLDEVVELAAECRATMLRRGQAESEAPTSVVLADGAVRPGRDHFPWLEAPRPWVLTEPLPGMPIGTVVDPLPVGALRDGSRALGLLPSCGRWARLEQVDEGKIVEWAAKRTKELVLDLGAGPDAMGAAEPVGGTETPPLGREARSAGGDRLGEKLGLAAEEPAESAAGKDDAYGDARTLWVDWDEQGERRKEFKRAVAESSNVKWDHHRLPADRTCLHTCKMMVNLSGSPRVWLERFLREKGIASTDRVAHELRVLCDILEEAGEFDQINLGGLACLEVAALRLNLLVDAHKTSGSASYSNAKYLSPLTEVDQLMAPGLRSHVSRRAKEEYELMQGDKKAEAVAAGAAGARVPPREGADDAAKGGKGGGGGGRGNKTRARALAPPVQVDDIVGEAGRTYLKENQKRMRRPIEEIDFDNLPTPYFDPLLKRNKKMYHNFLKDLSSRGLLLATLSPAEQAGLFFVKKADSDKMRMIVDARRANAWFGVPPSVQLLSCEGFGRVEVKLPEGVAFGSARGEELLNGFKLFLGMTDVKDCFYRMRIPVSLAKFFSLPAAPAHVLGLEGHELEGTRLGCDTLVFPCIGALPMGFSWSLFLAQDANEERVVRSDPWPGGDMAVSERVLMSDRGPPLVVEVEPGLHGGAYVYVDNMGVLAPSEGLAKSALESWTGLFEGVGLDLHKSSVGSGACEALGTKLDLELMRSGVSDGRFWKVYLGLGGLLARGRATGRALEVVLGHCTFCGLALRGSLSCWHASYRFIQRHYLEPARLWAEVVKEIKMFRGLLTLMVQDWWRPWNCCVLQTDASESGWGMAQSFWPQHVVEQVGRLPERARFRSALGRPARESALAAANLARDSSGALCSFEDMKNPDSLASDLLSSWELDPGFAEVPWQWLRKGAWETVRLPTRQSRRAMAPERARVLAGPAPRARTPPLRAGARRPAARTRALAAVAAPAGSRSDPSGARAIASPGALGRARILAPAPLLPSKKRASQAGRHLSALDERDANGLDLAGDAGEDAEGDSSSSGSDSVVEQLGRTRARMRQLRARRAHRRAKLYADAILAAQGEGVSLLETLAVTQATQVRYQRYLDRFYSRAGLSRRQILAKPDTEIDELMCNYMTENYLQGEQSNYGDQTVAAWVSANPDFGRVGGRKLPRTWRALKAWRRLTPGRRRKALALPVWCGLAWRLAQRGHLRLGIFLMIGVSIYGRPSTLLAARRCDLVPPSPGVSRHWALLTHPLERKRPSKRGHFDEGCPLDSPYLQGLDEVFERLASTTSKEPLWNFSYPEAATLLKEAAEDLGVAPVTLYQMRHSGASIDLAKGWRSLTSAQRRGEWTQAKSMHRYEHSSRLGSDYAKLDPRLRATCEEAERQLALILTGQYLGDLFAGCRAVSRAAEAEGFRARSWDVIYDAKWQDLLSPAVLRAIKADARAGRLVAATMAPPCQTFSLAHDRSRPVRSREKPWGFPASELTPADAEAVELGLKDSIVVGIHYYTASLAAVCPACPEAHCPSLPACPPLSCGDCRCPEGSSIPYVAATGALIAVGFLTFGLAVGSRIRFLAGRLLPALVCPRRSSGAGSQGPAPPAREQKGVAAALPDVPHLPTSVVGEDFAAEARAQAAAVRERRAAVAFRGYAWRRLAPGDFIAVKCNVAGAALWHERCVLLISSQPPHSFTGFTPDGDCYEEDLMPGGDISAWTPLEGAAAYVDNFVTLGKSARCVNDRLQYISQRLQSLGLAVHELQPASEDAEFLGLTLRRGRELSVRHKNISRLRYALEEILKRGRCSGALMRVLVGHITWTTLMRREGLSILQSVYAFVEFAGSTPSTLWQSVRRELWQVRSLLPLLRLDVSVVTAVFSGNLEPSYLEVSEAEFDEAPFRRLALGFRSNCTGTERDLATWTQLDSNLGDFRNALLESGKASGTGPQPLEARAYFIPEVQGAARSLPPRSCRLAVAGKRRVPPRTRCLLPKAAALAIAGHPACAVPPRSALGVAPACSRHLWPCECFRLKNRNLVRPPPATGPQHSRPAETQRRGSWQAPSSMKWFAKEAKLLAKMGQVRVDVVKLGRRVESLFAGTLLGGLLTQPLAGSVPARLQACLREAPTERQAALRGRVARSQRPHLVLSGKRVLSRSLVQPASTWS